MDPLNLFTKGRRLNYALRVRIVTSDCREVQHMVAHLSRHSDVFHIRTIFYV